MQWTADLFGYELHELWEGRSMLIQLACHMPRPKASSARCTMVQARDDAASYCVWEITHTSSQSATDRNHSRRSGE
jgi:hypothetical protein